jgi:predicted amidohydrolase
MSVSLERLARNGALFREVNERLRELSKGSQGASMRFVCECSNEDCTLTITMNHDEYESVRAHSTFFVIATGHEILEVEKIIDRRDGWTIVQKVAETDYAVETDPRRRDGAAEDGFR